MNQEIKDTVRKSYAAVALDAATPGSEGTRRVAQSFGYDAEELASVPAEANLGLSCGNPTAMAQIREGDVVVDLGCGGGLDVFLAARKVGPQGRVIGIDMTPEMLERARANADKLGLANVSFHHAEIESLPLADASVDCVLSNCVLNLVPDKPAAFREILRILKPGGRLAASDIALKRPLPEELAGDLFAYVGCIAGAIEIPVYRQWLEEAGFRNVVLEDTQSDLNAYAQLGGQSVCCAPTMAAPGALPIVEVPCCTTTPDADLYARLQGLLAKYDVNDYAASVAVTAIRPA